ncbi:MAG: hypothetical protein Q9174_006224, partial [Haloplaca sp. 1 TL-2023]
LGEAFESWYRQIGAGNPADAVVNAPTSIQDKSYTDVSGDDDSPPTQAIYECTYLRSTATIIAQDLKSPLSKLQRAGFSKNDALASLPELSRYSDVIWYIWTEILSRNDPRDGPVDTLPENSRYGPRDPGRLRYLGHDFVTSPTTEAIMDEIMGTGTVAWPGYTFGMDSEQGLALMGTPNAGATAWVMRDRYGELGRRRPRVTVWKPVVAGYSYPCMLWYLADW